MNTLTILEETVLLAILRLKDDAYGVSIRKKISEITNKNMIYGTLYNTLDQLVKKGFVRKTEGEPVPERGGRRKIYYTITDPGFEVLQETREHHRSLWEGIPELLVRKRQI